MTRATAAYLEGEDALAAWIDEAGTRDPNAWEKTTALYASWKSWADRAGEHAGTMKRFVQNIEARDLTPERMKHGRGFRGLKLKGDLYGDGY